MKIEIAIAVAFRRSLESAEVTLSLGSRDFRIQRTASHDQERKADQIEEDRRNEEVQIVNSWKQKENSPQKIFNGKQNSQISLQIRTNTNSQCCAKNEMFNKFDRTHLDRPAERTRGRRRCRSFPGCIRPIGANDLQFVCSPVE